MHLQTTSPSARAGNANAWPIQGHTNALAWNTSMPYSPAGHPLTSPNQAINPVATLVMSADFAAALAKALAAASKPLTVIWPLSVMPSLLLVPVSLVSAMLPPSSAWPLRIAVTSGR